MFKSIYKKIAEDFAFLSEFEYRFDHNLSHHVLPSVVFLSDKTKLQIGYRYDENQMYVLRYAPADSFNDEDLLMGTSLVGPSYKDQVGQVKEVLLKYLLNEQQSKK